MIWIVFIIGIFMIGFIYAILEKPISISHNLFYNDSSLNQSDYQNVYTRARTIWVWFPLGIIIGMILWLIIQLQKRSGYA
jgi:Trk-type K+ transport system membrane component